MINQINETIASREAPFCFLCGNKGEPLYSNLKDRLFNAPGIWHLKQCPNSSCGLVWLDPMPTEEDIGKAYETYYTHESDCRVRGGLKAFIKKAYRFACQGYLTRRYSFAPPRFSWQKFLGMFFYFLPAWRDYLDLSVMGLRSCPGGQVLDVGCGSGRKLEALRSVGWQVQGVDVDPAAVRQGRKKGLQVHLGTLQEQRYPDNHFTAITMNHVIEHVHDPIGLLAECRRILKPNGLLVLVTPNLESWGHRIFHKACGHLDPPRHLYLYNAKTLGSLAERSKFSGYSLSTSARGAIFVYQTSRAIASRGTFSTDTTISFGDHLKSGTFFCLEWALLKFQPYLGEALVLTCRK